MNRKDFTKKLAALGVCPFILSGFGFDIDNSSPDDNEEIKKIKSKKEFVENWLTDLLESMEKTVDRDTAVKIIEGCGRGCYNRFSFKQDIARKGKGDLKKLIDAYSENFEIWQEGNLVHVRYGEVSKQCYCSAANYRPAKPGDLHCECTRTTHQTIFETALGRPIKMNIVESLRRGGKTCWFTAEV